jgi:hypothetical protein
MRENEIKSVFGPLRFFRFVYPEKNKEKFIKNENNLTNTFTNKEVLFDDEKRCVKNDYDENTIKNNEEVIITLKCNSCSLEHEFEVKKCLYCGHDNNNEKKLKEPNLLIFSLTDPQKIYKNPDNSC